jgi:DNA-directed RNA polymerase subunit RPC12/RpoP
MNQLKQNLNINLDITQTTEVLCNDCGHNIFVPAFMFREASKFLTGTSEDALIPIQIFVCDDCGKPMEQSIPVDLKKPKIDTK